MALVEDDLPFQPRDGEVCAIRVPGQRAPRLAPADDLQSSNTGCDDHGKALEGSGRVPPCGFLGRGDGGGRVILICCRLHAGRS